MALAEQASRISVRSVLQVGCSPAALRCMLLANPRLAVATTVPPGAAALEVLDEFPMATLRHEAHPAAAFQLVHVPRQPDRDSLRAALDLARAAADPWAREVAVVMDDVGGDIETAYEFLDEEWPLHRLRSMTLGPPMVVRWAAK
jgi:hypothetical protein